jgi:hypothetical protein
MLGQKNGSGSPNRFFGSTPSPLERAPSAGRQAAGGASEDKPEHRHRGTPRARSGARGCGAPPGVDARDIDRPGGPPKLSPEELHKLVRVYRILNAWYEEDHR